MTVTARGDNQTAEVKIPAICEDEGGRIAFNINYILEYLKGNERLVELGISTPTAPACFLDGRSTVLIMPMSVQDEASKEAEDKAPEPEKTTEGETAENINREPETAGAAVVDKEETAVEAPAVAEGEAGDRSARGRGRKRKKKG